MNSWQALYRNNEATHTRAHLQLIAYIQILIGAFVALSGAAWCAFWLIMGRHMHDFDFVASHSANESGPSYYSPTYYFVLLARYFVIMVLFSAIPGVIAGIGLLRFKPWARKLAILVSIVDIVLLFPVHLILGLYGLVMLTKSEVREMF